MARPHMDDFYTIEEIAQKLRIQPGTVRNRLMQRLDMPPSVRIGRRRLFPIAEYEQWCAHAIEQARPANDPDLAAFNSTYPPVPMPAQLLAGR